MFCQGKLTESITAERIRPRQVENNLGVLKGNLVTKRVVESGEVLVVRSTVGECQIQISIAFLERIISITVKGINRFTKRSQNPMFALSLNGPGLNGLFHCN